MGPHPLSTIPFWRRINRLRNKTQQQNVGDLMVDGLKVSTNSGKTKVLADQLEGVFSSNIDPKYDKNNFQDINRKLSAGGIENLYDNNEKTTTIFSMQEIMKAMKNSNKKHHSIKTAFRIVFYDKCGTPVSLWSVSCL